MSSSTKAPDQAPQTAQQTQYQPRPRKSLDEQRETLRHLGGTDWAPAVGQIWESQRSSFAPAWDQLNHHTQLSIYRLLAH